jgi:hypothetical protein
MHRDIPGFIATQWSNLQSPPSPQMNGETHVQVSPPPRVGEKSEKEKDEEEQIEVNMFCLCRGFVIVLRFEEG